VADGIALPRPHFREVLASSLDVVVREVLLSMTATELSQPLFQVFRTAPRYREHRLVLRILLKKMCFSLFFINFFFRSNPLSRRMPSTLVSFSEWSMGGRSARQLVNSYLTLAMPCPLPSIDAVDSTTRRIYSTPWRASMSPRGTTLP
jgi:hypothetical protein